MPGIYDYPRYYEIAFSFRDIAAEVDLFEECFQRFGQIPVKNVLELGCGNCPHMLELLKRGYHYTGLDLCEAMLEYSKNKAREAGSEYRLIRANMNDFTLDTPVDFVFVLVGSLFAENTADLHRHFRTVAKAVKPGGLYLLDWCVQFDPLLEKEEGVSWELEADGIKVKTTVAWTPVNRAEQLADEKITFEVDDKGEQLTVSGTDTRRYIHPQEFLQMISNSRFWEFVGWFNNWNLADPLGSSLKIDRPVILLRRV